MGRYPGSRQPEETLSCIMTAARSKPEGALGWVWGGTMYHDPRRERKAELDSDRHVRSGDQAAPPIKRVPRGGMRWGSLR